MMWLFAVLIVGLIGAVAVVAAGSGDSMVQEYDDRPDVRVQADGPLSGGDLRRMRFTTAMRGYRACEVDALLARLAHELDERAPAPAADPASGPTSGPAPDPAGDPTAGPTPDPPTEPAAPAQ